MKINSITVKPNTSIVSSLIVEVYSVVVDALQINEIKMTLDSNTALLGNFPELDSMAVVTVITALEARFDFIVNDDDDLATAFETFGSLALYIEEKRGA